MNLFLQLLGNGIAQGAVAMLYAAGFGFVGLTEDAYGGSDPQLTDGDVFRTEVSLKALEVALKDLEVALIGQEVAQRLNFVKEKLKGLARTDVIENAIDVLADLSGQGRRTAERYLGALVLLKQVEFRGAPKNGGYYAIGSKGAPHG